MNPMTGEIVEISDSDLNKSSQQESDLKQQLLQKLELQTQEPKTPLQCLPDAFIASIKEATAGFTRQQRRAWARNFSNGLVKIMGQK